MSPVEPSPLHQDAKAVIAAKSTFSPEEQDHLGLCDDIASFMQATAILHEQHTLAKRRITLLEGHLSAALTTEQTAQRKRDLAQGRIVQLEAALAATGQAGAGALESLEAARGQIATLERRLTEAQEARTAAEGRVSLLERQLAGAAAPCEPPEQPKGGPLSTPAEALEKEFAELKAYLEALMLKKQERHSLRTEKDAIIEGTQTEVARQIAEKLQAQIVSLEDRLTEAQEARAAAEDQVTLLERQLASAAKDTNCRVAAAVARAKGEAARTLEQVERDADLRVQEATKRAEAAEGNLIGLSQRVEKLSEEVLALKEERESDLRAQRAQTQFCRRDAESTAKLRAEIAANNGRLESRVEELQSERERLQALLAESRRQRDEDAKAHAEELDASLDRSRSLEGSLGDKLRTIEETLHREREAYAYDMAIFQHELERTVQMADAAVAGGSVAREAEVERLNAELQRERALRREAENEVIRQHEETHTRVAEAVAEEQETSRQLAAQAVAADRQRIMDALFAEGSLYAALAKYCDLKIEASQDPVASIQAMSKQMLALIGHVQKHSAALKQALHGQTPSETRS